MINDVQIAVRLPQSVVDGIDGLARSLSKEQGLKITRAAFVRRILEREIASSTEAPSAREEL